MKNQQKKQTTLDKQWLFFIAIGVIVLAVVAALIIFDNTKTDPTVPSAATVAVDNDSDETNLNAVDENSEEAKMVRATAANYLDTFISCDFEALKTLIHPDDAPFFNFESETQMDFYKAIFPRITYEIKSVWEKDGVYGAKTTITAPNMAEAIGDIHVEQIDNVIAGDTTSNQTMEEISDKILTAIKSGGLSDASYDVYVIVQAENGQYVPRCNEYIANALLGGYPEASQELINTMMSSMDALSE
ncbi:MAG: hypothetical protein IJ300_14445 [Clostridia bacterium]|nr:hypothetical protein [Clostridia bacterium]